MSRATRFLVFVVVILALVVMPLGYSAQAVQGPDSADFSARVEGGTAGAALPLKATAPAPAQVGDEVVFTVSSDGAQGVAGFQFALRYDEAGLGFVKAEVSDAVKAAGFDVLMMGPVHRNGQVFFGAVACPVADCASTDYGQPRATVDGLSGNVELAKLTFKVRQPGSYTFDLGQARMVATSGASVAAPQNAAAELQAASMQSLDLTGNLTINDSDAYQVIGAWEYLTGESESGLCITPALASYDLDGSGCVDVGDAQAILNHWGERMDASGAPLSAPLSENAVNAVFSVDSNGDQPDANPGNGVCATAGGACTLRAAIMESNVLAGQDTINFNVRNGDGSCPALVTISPATSLTIDDPSGAGVFINGYSQCNASANSQQIAGNAVIKVELSGNLAVGVYGINIVSQNNIVKGLAVYNFHSQIMIRGTRAHTNAIQGNFVGTNAAQTVQMTIAGESFNGLDIANNAANNLIGGTAHADRNLISGADQDGLNIQGPGVNSNLIVNNYIGLKQNGVNSLRNKSDGIDLAGGTHHNVIGGLNANERNVMAGNGGDGIEISHDGTHDNDVVGNFIGLNATGTGVTPNFEKGITFEDDVVNNRAYRNVIAGNGGYGVRFYTASDNQLFDNFIGVIPAGLGANTVVPVPGSVPFANLTAAGNGALPAQDSGLIGVLLLGGSQNNLIRNNVIANHPQYGVAVSVVKGYLPIGTCNTWFNTISRNYIYNNGLSGIHLYSSTCDGQPVAGNQGLAAPTITAVTPSQVSGTACPNCTIEVFIADKTQVNSPDGDNFGEGKLLVGVGTANASGVFNVNVTGVTAGWLVTATATSANGNTSAFARNTAVGSGQASSFRVLLPLVVR